MHIINRIPALAGFAIVFGLAAAPIASAASSDACTLVTQSNVSDAVGASFGAGQHVPPKAEKNCTWTRPGHADGVKMVTLELSDASQFEIGKNHYMGMHTPMPNTEASAGDVGDDSYYLSMHGRYTALLVKKGNVEFKVAIYGKIPAAEAKGVAKALALKVLANL